MSKKEINFKKEMEVTEVVSYLKALAESLEAGKVVVDVGDQVVSLTPAGEIELEVEAKRRENREKLSLNLRWKLKLPEEKPAEQKLEISSTEPEHLEEDKDDRKTISIP